MSEKNLDHRGRWRNKTVAFRVSKEEWDLIESYVEVSGLTKQDYITKRLTCRDVIVVGNPKVYKGLKNQLEEVSGKLKEISGIKDMGGDFLELLSMIGNIMDRMKEDGLCQKQKE